ncbi:hypothetical protein ACFL1X_02555 [Candidatus Hydrogenedentota bacterium]
MWKVLHIVILKGSAMPSEFIGKVLDAKIQLGVFASACAISMILSVIFDRTPSTGYGDYSVVVAYVFLGVFYLPLAFANVIGLGVHMNSVVLVIAGLLYWPSLATMVVCYLRIKRVVFAVPAVVLIIIPSFTIAKLFEISMGV